MLGFTPPTLLPFIFYFKQTNMKLLLQIKGESSSVIPEGLANGGAGPPIWKEREDCGAKQPLPGVHKSARVPVRDQLLAGLQPAQPGGVMASEGLPGISRRR